MTNYCHNTLVITGPKDELERFMAFAKSGGSVFDFDHFVKYPESEHIKTKGGKDAPKSGFNRGGDEWCRENWGTRWNSGDVHVEEKEGEVIYYFDTGWTPPIPVVRKAIELFPTVSFDLYYCEPLLRYEGRLFGCKGKVTIDETSEFIRD
jgi:Ferredoxin-like domain in Api92-like protein